MIIMEEEESSSTVLHAVDIRAAKRKRRIQPVGEIMSNRAEKDAVRWCHVTHQVFAGASVHSREHKTSLVRCTDIFFEETYKP